VTPVTLRPIPRNPSTKVVSLYVMRLTRQTTHKATPGAARALTLQALHASKRARRELVVIVPLMVAVFVVNSNRRDWFDRDLQPAVRVGLALCIAGLGWRLARDFHRSAAPVLFRRMDPATAGTVGFLVRLVLMLVVALTVLSVAGINTQTLAVGGALFAVIFGLAAQQTLGNVIAGLVLIAAQPFRVGDRVRLQAGGVAGQLEGVVEAHGLLYTTFAQGEDSIMVPNNVVLSAAVVPLREPSGVDLRARLRPDVKPSDVQSVIDSHIDTPTRGEPRIELEEIDADEVVVRIRATPESEADGPRLADEILAAISSLAQEGYTEERQVARAGAS
jgi:small-conductance mechanosensitive channel